MNLFNTPRDKNGLALVGHGREVMTNRFEITATAAVLRMAYDFKEAIIHYEGAGAAFSMQGTIPGRKWFIDATAIEDSGDNVIIHSTASNLTIGDTVIIAGCATSGGTVLVANGSYVIQAGSDADHIVVPATYVAGTPVATGYVIGYRRAFLTTNGYTITLPVTAIGGQTIASLFHASSGVISVIAWR